MNYTLTPKEDIPRGLDFTTATRTLAGTPNTAMTTVTLTYRVTDSADSPTTAELTFMVTVNKGEQTSFVFPDAAVNKIIEEDSSTFTVTVTGGSGDGAVTYKSDDTAVATVDNNGKVTIVAIGRTTITATKATDANYNEATAFYILTINPAPLAFDTSMIPTPNSAYTYNVGSTVTLSLPPATGGLAPLRYRLTGVIPDGLRFTTATLTLAGTPTAAMTTVTLTYMVTDSADTPATAALTFMVTVNKGEQTSFVFPDATVNKIIGEDSSTFTVTVTGGSGNGAVTYESDDTAVATVDNSGKVTIVAIGTTTITATKATDANYNEAMAAYTLTVITAGAFITTWQIEPNTGTDTDNNIITIPIHEDSSYRYTVNWGEGPEDTTIYTNTIPATYTYPDTVTATSYKVAITGVFPRIYFNNEGDDKDKIISIDQWGSNRWDSMESAFFGCSNLGYTAKDTPDLSQVTDMSHMFQGAALFNGDIGGWDVSNVADMSNMFAEAAIFNGDIGGWDVSNVADMSNMFANAALFNGNIGDWEDKVGQVTDMSFMFQSASAFNQNISQWEVNNVTDMSFMFESASEFNRPISDWDVDNVTDMSFMFSGATEFNQDISLWEVNNVTDMSSMFEFALAFDQDIGDWNVNNVTDMSSMFSGASEFNQNISDWKVNNVTDMSFMFEFASAFNWYIGGWNVSTVTDMNSMFFDASRFNQNISGWKVGEVTDMSFMFSGATAFDQTSAVGMSARLEICSICLKVLLFLSTITMPYWPAGAC